MLVLYIKWSCLSNITRFEVWSVFLEQVGKETESQTPNFYPHLMFSTFVLSETTNQSWLSLTWKCLANIHSELSLEWMAQTGIKVQKRAHKEPHFLSRSCSVYFCFHQTSNNWDRKSSYAISVSLTSTK